MTLKNNLILSKMVDMASNIAEVSVLCYITTHVKMTNEINVQNY